MMTKYIVCVLFVAFATNVCPTFAQTPSTSENMEAKLKQYLTIRLQADLAHLSADERRMLSLFVRAAQLMDEVYRLQRYPDWEAALSKIADQPTRQYFQINYGPYDILDGERSFVAGIPDRAPGGFFYPLDMTLAEWEAWQNPLKDNAYTVVKRDATGKLFAITYHQHYRIYHQKAAELLEQAASYAPQPQLKAYLNARAHALRTDDYVASDEAWLDMKDNRVDIVIGPIESYDDGLLGIRTAHEAFVLVKDMEWSERLARFSQLLPQLQENLPVPAAYRAEKPGTDGDLNAYDVLLYAGDCNAGPKTMAINLPNDEGVQLRKGTRRLQLKNTMQAKFDNILVPIVNELLNPEQVASVTFDAFFANTMFHEVAHGLGIKYVVGGSGKFVKDALKETHSAIEEAKADVLGLYMVSKLYEWGHLTEGDVKHNYITFVCGIFRSTRFGTGSAHAKANLLALHHFLRQGALIVQADGRYLVDVNKIPAAVASLADKILRIQGDGDYAAAKAWLEQDGSLPPHYVAAMDKLKARSIPVDIIFEQGLSILGLE